MTLAELSSTEVMIERRRGGNARRELDTLAVEEPLEIRLGYRDLRRGRLHRSVAITMRTPGDDLALALGFLHGEGLVPRLAAVAEQTQVGANVVRIELHDDVVFDPQRLERNFYTTSSCGVCGKSSLENLSQAGFEALPQGDFAIRYSVLEQLPRQLAARQHLFRKTGGNHATATFDSCGMLLHVTEDVGRHNAMDKLVGHYLRQQQLPLSNLGLLVSGRASFELLQKALAARAPLLAAVGAPSSLAVELAQEYNVTLIGFLGEQGCNVYHGGFRLLD
ncbi:MAG: formate dehydrogenase accessory sulfurtransferase FdhD [Pseudohongiellaceae bacterium]